MIAGWGCLKFKKTMLFILFENLTEFNAKERITNNHEYNKY